MYKSVRASGLGVIVWMAAMAPAWAQTMIQSVNTFQQGKTDVIRVEFSQPLTAAPSGFAVQAPPRLALDLAGVQNGLGRGTVDVNQGNVRTIALAQASDRTRLVVNLKQAASYRTEIDGSALMVYVDAMGGGASQERSGAANADAASGNNTRFAESLNTRPLSIRGVDFRRGGEGSGRVVVDLPSNQVGVDIKQQGRGLVLEFLKSTLPDSLRRRLDVTDFGTPVNSIVASQQGDRVRMVVEARGAWEHSAYQSDSQFVLEVRPVKQDPNKLTKGPGYAGEKLSLNFQSIEVRALLQVIADFTNFNVVTSDTVTGNVTLRLKDVPWDQALDIILQAKGLAMRKSGNVIWIAPKEEVLAKEKSEFETKSQISSLEPVRTQSFQLNYVKAAEVAASLTAQSGSSSGGDSKDARLLSPRGSVVFEARTNQLFVTDIPSKLEEVQAVITKIDVPVRQVLIEARIVEATDAFGRTLGVKLGGVDARLSNSAGTVVPGYDVGNRWLGVGGNLNSVGSQTGQPGASGGFNDTNFVNMPAGGQNGFQAASFALTLFGAGASRFLNLELSALEADGKGKIVSSPRVITADQVKALIEQGTELPYQAATSAGATQVQFKKANLKLEVTPQITPEGAVILDVDINKDSVGRITASGFAIDTKHVKTQVLIENGGTVVIGGIFEQIEREDITKVPFLGDIPFVGNLFKNRSKTSSRVELLIFLTPKVITDRTSLQ